MQRYLLPLVVIMATIASVPIQAAEKEKENLPHVNFCTGVRDGNYDFVGVEIAKQATGKLHGKLINTKGSMENLSKLDVEECDVAIVQSDAFVLYSKQNPRSGLNVERGRTLYSEYVHFICNNNARLSKITGLDKTQTVLIGDPDSGSAVTWESFKLADPERYGVIPTRPVGGTRAANSVQDGTDASCMFAVFGLKAPTIMDIDLLAGTSGDKIRLINAADSDLPKIKDSKGRPLYVINDIPGKTYPHLQHGFFGSSVPTLTVEAILVANTKWVEKEKDAYERLLKAVNAAMPTINNRVHP